MRNVDYYLFWQCIHPRHWLYLSLDQWKMYRWIFIIHSQGRNHPLEKRSCASETTSPTFQQPIEYNIWRKYHYCGCFHHVYGKKLNRRFVSPLKHCRSICSLVMKVRWQLVNYLNNLKTPSQRQRNMRTWHPIVDRCWRALVPSTTVGCWQTLVLFLMMTGWQALVLVNGNRPTNDGVVGPMQKARKQRCHQVALTNAGQQLH